MAGLIAMLFLQINPSNAQGFLKKLAAAMAPKPINGVWDMGLGANGKFTYAQTGTQFTQFDHPKENSDKKLEINYTGSAFGTRFERFTSFSIPKIYLEREQQPNWYMFQTEDSTFFIVNRMDNYKFDATKNLLGIVTSNKELIKELLNWDPKKEATTDLIKKNLKEVQTLCDKITQGFADKEKAEKAKQDSARANYELPTPSTFYPAGVTQKVIADAFYKRFEKSMDAGTLKLTYAYFGSHKIHKLKPMKEWNIIKEKKTVNGTYDNFITKRSIDVICVIQNETDIKNGTYSLFLVQLYEDAAFGVYDGSKWSGTYYINSHSFADPYTPKDRMMKYKDLLK